MWRRVTRRGKLCVCVCCCGAQSTSAAAKQTSKLRAERKELRRLTEQLASLNPVALSAAMGRPAVVAAAADSASASATTAAVIAAVHAMEPPCASPAAATTETGESGGDSPTEAWVRRGHDHDTATGNSGGLLEAASPLVVEMDLSDTDAEDDDHTIPVHAALEAKKKAAAENVDPNLTASLDSLRDSLKMSIESLSAEAATAATAATSPVVAGALPPAPAARGPLRESSDANNGGEGGGGAGRGGSREQKAAEAQRLLQERADLLRTGVYSKDDRLIKELDRCIASL